MDSRTSTTLVFRTSEDAASDELVRLLTGVFHAVPSATGPDGDLLTVEVDGDYPELVDEVRQLVLEGDPGATEVHDSVDA